MSVLIITPVSRGSRSGNGVTARRWARLLRDKRNVRIARELTSQRYDVLLAIHARKSAAAVVRSKQQHPDRPVILLLSGTDLYDDLPRRDPDTLKSLDLADRLAILQPLARRSVPSQHRRKCRVVLQSAEPPPTPVTKLKSAFEVVVLGHLREVKDPFRAARAVRDLPVDSRLRITHMGAALDDAMRRQAVAEQATNTRYRWLGNIAHWRARRILARSQALVVSSKLEGGANVVSEAVVAGVPVLASKVDGNVGLLGARYGGYFPCGDTGALRKLLVRLEREETFRARLQRHVAQLAPQFTPDAERAALVDLIDNP